MALDAQAGYGEAAGVREARLRQGEAYSLRGILAHLIEAAGILLDRKDYDGHGWEILDTARKLARDEVMPALTVALAQPAAPAAPGGGFLHPCHGALTDRATIQRILDGSTLTVGRTGVDAVEFDPEDEDSFVPQRPETTGADAVERVADFLYCLKGGKTWGYDYADSERDAKKLLRAIGRGEK